MEPLLPSSVRLLDLVPQPFGGGTAEQNVAALFTGGGIFGPELLKSMETACKEQARVMPSMLAMTRRLLGLDAGCRTSSASLLRTDDGPKGTRLIARALLLLSPFAEVPISGFIPVEALKIAAQALERALGLEEACLWSATNLYMVLRAEIANEQASSVSTMARPDFASGGETSVQAWAGVWRVIWARLANENLGAQLEATALRARLVEAE
eukprot:1340617-Prymnesium_polylepis.1